MCDIDVTQMLAYVLLIFAYFLLSTLMQTNPQKQPLADVFQNKCFSKILQYSQENTSAGVSL